MIKKKKVHLESENNIKKKISYTLDLPREIVLDLPLISIMGKEEINIENYKSILEYSEGLIKINTSIGIIKIEGKNLTLKQITKEYILISGKLISFEYLI